MERVSEYDLGRWAASARERWNVPGIAVGVLQDGAVVMAADGQQELGQPKPVTPETVFRIASITKPFTATLTMTLVQDGLLALDEPAPGTRIDATVRQLLSHQAGLAAEWPEPLDDSGLLELTEGEPERLPVAAGELFSYCNSGFWFVAAGIARTLGTSFEDAMRSRVIEPLRLASTGFETDEPARGHEQVEPGADEHRRAETWYPPGRTASGGLWSSVPDLLRFAEHHLGAADGRTRESSDLSSGVASDASGPLTASSLAEMQRPCSYGPGFRYGLGWFLRRREGHDAVEHPGSVLGFQSLLTLVPDERMAFAALTNSSRGIAAIRDVLREMGLGEDEAGTVEPADLGRFAGRYRGQEGVVDITPEDGGLRVERTEIDPFSQEAMVLPTVRARPIGDREFEIVDGEWHGDRFDFPRPGFLCIDLRLLRAE
jgi:CubicO group peptidase (beta-lactamase class C family)